MEKGNILITLLIQRKRIWDTKEFTEFGIGSNLISYSLQEEMGN